MREEVEATTRQYLDGKIEQFWGRRDGPGGVLILNTSSREEAQSWLDALPLTREGSSPTNSSRSARSRN